MNSFKKAIKELVEKCAEYESVYNNYPEYKEYLDIAKERITEMVNILPKDNHELRAFAYSIQYHAYLMGFTACLEANGFLDEDKDN